MKYIKASLEKIKRKYISRKTNIRNNNGRKSALYKVEEIGSLIYFKKIWIVNNINRNIAI